MRNNLITKGKNTDAVDEVLLKIIDAKQKKFKVIYKEAWLWKKLFIMKRTVYGTNCKVTITFLAWMLMYGKEASNRKQEIDRQHYTIPNQRPKDKHCGKI